MPHAAVLHPSPISKTLRFEVFEDASIPKYAILSHTWSDGEVLLQEMEGNGARDKAGYHKILQGTELALKNSVPSIWVDTCCIDNWNLRERSKAINSMFRWYRDATKSYIFLSDVSVSAATETSERSAWEASFCASEWFTRGWTLQELIAPISVEFFSREGWWIGDKTSVEQLVHEITGIPLEALRNSPLNQFTISERIEWARNRRTTEEEDSVL